MKQVTTHFSVNKIKEGYRYFRNCRAFLEYHNFDTKLDKDVWTLHSEGLSLGKIAKKLGLSKSKTFLIVAKLKEALNGHKD